MRLRKCLRGLVVVLALLVSAPAFAHEDHDKASAARTQVATGPNAGMAAAPGPIGTVEDMDHGARMAGAAPAPMPRRLYRWFGAMHPAAVHFPIALFLVAAVLEIAALTLGRPVLTQGARVIIALAALSAVVAVMLGWFAMGPPGKDDATHAYHRWLGTSIAALGLLSWWAKEHWVRNPGRGRELVYIALLTITAAAVVLNGLLGGMLTHGLRHLML